MVALLFTISIDNLYSKIDKKRHNRNLQLHFQRISFQLLCKCLIDSRSSNLVAKFISQSEILGRIALVEATRRCMAAVMVQTCDLRGYNDLLVTAVQWRAEVRVHL